MIAEVFTVSSSSATGKVPTNWRKANVSSFV